MIVKKRERKGKRKRKGKGKRKRKENRRKVKRKKIAIQSINLGKHLNLNNLLNNMANSIQLID